MRIEAHLLSFTSMINVLEKSNDPKSTTRVMKLLRRMEELEKGGSDVVRLDAVAFRVALRVLSRFGDAKRAQKVLSWMEELYESGREELKPDEACYNSVIWAHTCNALKSSSQKIGMKQQRNDRGTAASLAAAEQAQELLVHMIQRFRQGETDILPGRSGFNAVIRAWADVGGAKGIQKAELLLKLMDELYQSCTTNFSADSATYSVIISALAKSTKDGAAVRAQELLDQMDSKGLVDTIAFNATISAWAKSKKPDKAEKAHSLLQKMADLHNTGDSNVTVDIVSYNTVLNACAFTRGGTEDKKKALLIAEDTFRRIQESKDLAPQELTYATMMKAYTNLAGNREDKIDMIRPIFAECAERGLVGNMVLKEIRYSLSEDQQKSLFESVTKVGNTNAGRIPNDWSRNVSRKYQ